MVSIAPLRRILMRLTLNSYTENSISIGKNAKIQTTTLS